MYPPRSQFLGKIFIMGFAMGWLNEIQFFFSSKCQVRFCEGADSGVMRCASLCIVNNCFKDLLLLNYLASFNQITQECSLGGSFSDSFKFLQSGPARGLSVFHRKILKNLLLINYLVNFNPQECSLGGPLSVSFKLWPRAKTGPTLELISFLEEYLENSSPKILQCQFLPNFTGMFLRWSYSRFL